jgi:hypothetical protein
MEKLSNGALGLLGTIGNVNPLVADALNTPIGATCVFVDAIRGKAMLTPVNVSVAVLAPDPKTTELVPDPLHGTVPAQKNTPLVVNAVSISRFPPGRMVNGMASASPVKGISTPRANRTSEQ